MDSITSLFIVHRYDSTTGTFAVPPGGDGYYSFTVFLTAYSGEVVYFDLELNGELSCTVYIDLTGSPDNQMASCSAVTYAVEGISDFIDF